MQWIRRSWRYRAQVQPDIPTSGDTADSPLGDGSALVMGVSSIPLPPETYVNAADTLYLRPRDTDVGAAD